MERLLLKPNLPKRSVKKVIISHSCEETENSLKKLGIECIRTEMRTNVRKGIYNHPDIHFCQLDSRTVIVSKEQKSIISALEKTEGDIRTASDIEVLIEENVKDGFPDETLLNCVFFGDAVIYNDKTVSPKILDYINKSGLKKIVVNQGYTKCSCVPVLNNAIITDDLVISKKAIEQGVDCLLVKKGQVKLKGYDYGFVGGCCGMIDKNKLAFNGELKYHSDCERIIGFLNKYGIQPIFLKQGELEDIGSIIPLTE